MACSPPSRSAVMSSFFVNLPPPRRGVVKQRCPHGATTPIPLVLIHDAARPTRNGMMSGKNSAILRHGRNDDGARPMKKLVLETTSPFQGLPELVAYDEGLFAKEGVQVEWADRDEAGVKTADTSLTDVEGRRPVRQPRHAARAGQGRHVQRLRMGQLLPRRRAPMSAAARSAAAPSSPMPPSWCGRTRRSTPRSSSPAAPSACRSMPARTISRCICWKASCRATRSTSAARPTARATAST